MMSEKARRDTIWALLIAVAAAALIYLSDFVEWWHAVTRAHESWELDELLGVIVGLLLGIAWYGWRRVGEVRSALRLQTAADAKLREKIDQFHAILDHAPVEIYVKDLQGRYLLANRRARELFAPDDGVIEGTTAHDLFPKENADVYVAQDRAVIESGRPATWEYELKSRHGLRQYVTARFPILSASGELTQIGAIVTDVTELKQHETALRDSEARLRAIIDNTPCGISLKDVEGRYILVNRWFESRIGATSEEIRGKRSHEIFGRDFAASGSAQDQAVLASGAVVENEEEWKLPDGVHTLFTVKFPVRDGAGQMVAIGSISSDISERKRAEEQERVNQARLQAILDYSPVALYLKDTDGRLLLVNKRFEEWFGVSNQAAFGKRFSEIFGHDKTRIGEVQEREVLHTGALQLREAETALSDGSLRSTMIASFPVFDAQGGILGTGGAEIDISDLKAAQLALQSAKEEADRANEAKSRFLAAASHDLRQPLHALNLLIEAMTADSQVEGQEEISTAMRQATSSMGEMLNALLDISQLDAGVIQPEPRNFRIGPILEDLARTAAGRAEAKGLEFRFVPSSAWIHADSSLLGRIVENFLSNAVRYTSEGKILLGCRRRGDRLRIEVWDSGVGIANDHLGKIFEEYYQLGNPARDRSKGLGLGLAIVERIARILDYPVEVCSTPGKGSVFAVAVPLGREIEQGVHQSEALVSGAELSGHSVLLIEDDSLVAEWTQRILHSWGLEVIAAKSPDETRRSLAEFGVQPSLIIADYRLPEGVSGLELIGQVRKEIGVSIPAIVTTGDTSPELARTCVAADCALLHKPVAPAKLRSLVRWLLSERRIA